MGPRAAGNRFGNRNAANRGSVSLEFSMAPVLSPAILAIALVSITAMAMKFFHTGGTYFLPLTAILLAIAMIWAGAEYLLMESRDPASPIRTSAADFTASPA